MSASVTAPALVESPQVGPPSVNRMTEKDAYDAFMAQASYFASRFDERRDYEWKFSIGFWTLLAAACGFLMGKAVVPWWCGFIPIVLHAIWLRGIWTANHADKKSCDDFRLQAIELLAGRSYSVPPRRQRLGFPKSLLGLFTWSPAFQLLCTVVLSVCLVELTHSHLSQMEQTKAAGQNPTAMNPAF